MMDSKRHFDKAQREYIYMKYKGVCAKCGIHVSKNGLWEADHITPFSRGGQTVIKNGQLLCMECNREKGSRMDKPLPEWPSNIILRPWQDEHYRLWREKLFNRWNHPDPQMRAFFSVAFPGSGKTIFLLRSAYEYLTLSQHGAKRPFIIVLVPSDRLVKQWHNECLKLGLPIEGRPKVKKTVRNEEVNIPVDLMGGIYTYQSLRTRIKEFQSICRAMNVLVILDEPHHVGGENMAGDYKAFGDHVTQAFNQAHAYLLASGTAWRSDSHPIVFAKYKRVGREFELVVDANYSYRDALSDTEKASVLSERICRKVRFQYIGGRVDFFYDMAEYSEDLTEELPADLVSPSLRTAYDPSLNHWFIDAFRDADATLQSIRNDHDNPYPHAAGLIVADSIEHAKAYQKLIKDITGEEMTRVDSEEIDASDMIDDFVHYPDKFPRWIISVRMITEGVDIPRLAIGMYLARIRKRLFYNQTIGRCIRWDKRGPSSQWAIWYIPQVEPFGSYGRDFDADILDIMKEPGQGGDGPEQKLFAAIDNEHALGGVYNADHFGATAQYVIIADELIKRLKFPNHSRDMVATALETYDKEHNITRPANEIERPPTDEREKYKRLYQTTIRRVIGNLWPDYHTLPNESQGKVQAGVRNYINKLFGVDTYESMTISQLKQAYELALSWLHTRTLPADLIEVVS